MKGTSPAKQADGQRGESEALVTSDIRDLIAMSLRSRALLRGNPFHAFLVNLTPGETGRCKIRPNRAFLPSDPRDNSRNSFLPPKLPMEFREVDKIMVRNSDSRKKKGCEIGIGHDLISEYEYRVSNEKDLTFERRVPPEWGTQFSVLRSDSIEQVEMGRKTSGKRRSSVTGIRNEV
ncbi:UNVERIFIED_CONTAM: hypothetical protein PYX00_007808 [Menopon gallinae]|uniref:Uncharacterized protein n=1 Tax=Menopon gallinae TaxID=328185 RepID=A0AAW2HKT3_9NEOP